MIVPVATEYGHVINVRTRERLAFLEDKVHSSLESCWGTVKTKGHNHELKKSEGRDESSFVSRLRGHRNLPKSFGEVERGYEGRIPDTLKDFFNSRHRVGMKMRCLV